ncbi:MAG: HAD family hydrolase [Candidatus Eisenbacteria bacterium]|nr:HAD family hydrolase [Candidatus Eisenbacteria bacterium]MCC7144148.1 HAD family hydrolase [Candidatus Eisenbacteria bacterium]
MPDRAGLICFDNDGTLFASHEVANPAIQEAHVAFCRAAGHELPAPTDAEICRLTGLPGLEFFVQLLPEPLKSRAAEFRLICVELEARDVLARGRLFPGARELLLELRARGKKLALVTNAGDRYIGAVAERVGYAALLDGLYHHGKDGMASKAEMLRAAHRDLGGAGVVMVGDRHSDLEGARATGAFFIGCTYGYGEAAELEGADRLVGSVAELRSLLVP